MANTKISALPTYTGDTTGVYLVMDNSGLTQSYKVAKETLMTGSSGSSGTSGSSGSSGTSGASGANGTSVPSYYLTSTSSITIDGSNPVFTTNIPGDTNGLQVGQFVRAYDATNSANYIQGTILVLIGTLLQITNQNQGGSGTHDSWIISSFGVNGTSGSSGSSGSSGTSGSSGSSGTSASVPGWTSAGTIQSVGWSATTTSPTVATSPDFNNISYRQLGVNQWEIVMSFSSNGSGASAGNGDYLFKLPNGLSFDSTIASQQTFTGNVQQNDSDFPRYIIPSGTGMITDGAGSTSTNFAPIIWNQTYFRLFAYIPGGAITCIGSTYFATTSFAGFQLTFQFTST
jgi:hypothetical protein